MRRGPAIKEPRYIKPETICIGDTLKIRWQDGDLEMTRTGKVGARSYWTNATSYTTIGGMLLMDAFGDGTTNPPKATITLLDRMVTDQPTLEGIEI